MMSYTQQLRAAGLALVLAAGGATAQEGTFSQPLRSGSNQPHAQSTTTMRSDDGESQVEVRIQDGQVTAKVNGKKVAADRIVREGDEIRILGKGDEVIAKFNYSAVPQPPKAPKAAKAPKAPKTPAPPSWQPGQELPADWTPPKVMIGIVMGEPSAEILKNYDLKEGQAILIERVAEGLPAAEAGVQENDLITEIDGHKPANQERLREILKGKDPGDTLTFTVLRKGGDQTIRVTLAPFNAEKLGMVQGGQGMFPPGGGMTFQVPGEGQWRTFRPDGEGRAFVLGGQGNLDDKMSELDQKMAELDEKLAKVNDQIAKLQELIEKLAKQRQDK